MAQCILKLVFMDISNCVIIHISAPFIFVRPCKSPLESRVNERSTTLQARVKVLRQQLSRVAICTFVQVVMCLLITLKFTKGTKRQVTSCRQDEFSHE